MSYIKERVDFFIQEHKIIEEAKKLQPGKKLDNELPGNVFFLNDGSVMCLDRNIGVSRFQYGEDGFNFWTYDSGYMHANDGLFSPFLRASEGEEPKIAFFAGFKNKDKYIPLSLLKVPTIDESKISRVTRYTVFDEISTYYITETPDFIFTVVAFNSENNELNFSVLLRKKYRNKKNIYLAWYFNPHLSHIPSENNETRWFKTSKFNLDQENSPLGRFVFRINEDLSRYLSVDNFGVLNQSIKMKDIEIKSVEATTSRKNFTGNENASIGESQSVISGKFPKDVHSTAFTDSGIAGEIIHLETTGKSELRLDFLFNYKIYSTRPESYTDLYKSGEFRFDEMLHYKKSEYDELSKRLEADFSYESDIKINGNTFSNFFRYLKKQVEFCATINGYAQLAPNSLIGVRDVFQAIEAFLFSRPDLAREKILEGLNFLDPSGRAPRQYSLPLSEDDMPRMDLRPFIDQGIWIVNTIITYLKFTRDMSILDEKCGYYEITDGRAGVVKRSKLRDSALEHVIKIIDYLVANIDEDTNCLKAIYGDWVDALDGLGVSKSNKSAYGNGVSVMASLQFYKMLGEVIELLELIKYDKEKIASYAEVRASLKTGIEKYAVVRNELGDPRVIHGWGDGREYLVGSFHDIDNRARNSLVANAFWILSDIYLENDKDITKSVKSAFENLDSKYGMRTFVPPFKAGTKGVGRIHKLIEGTAENGSIYVHGTTFGIAALFRMGESEKAWENLFKILPITHDNLTTSPFVMANSYSLNESLGIDGESMHDWQTGSSNMVMKILIRYVFGLRFEYSGIIFQPAAYCPFDSWEFKINYAGKRLAVSYKKEGVPRRRFRVNEKVIEGQYNNQLKTYTLSLKDSDLGDGNYVTVEIID